MNAEEFRRAAHTAIDESESFNLESMICNEMEVNELEVIDHFSNLDSKRVVSNVSPGYLRPLLPAAPPEEGEKWEDIQKDIEAKILPGLTHW